MNVRIFYGKKAFATSKKTLNGLFNIANNAVWRIGTKGFKKMTFESAMASLKAESILEQCVDMYFVGLSEIGFEKSCLYEDPPDDS